MLELYIPKIDDLWFRKMFLSDEETMTYNHAWGGIIDWPEEKWANWYDEWVLNSKSNRFYRYLRNVETNEFVGEVAYHFEDNKCLADVIIYSKYRRNGYGKEGLRLLCEEAKNSGIDCLYDDIAIDNPALNMFIKCGFYEIYRTDKIIMLKKDL